MNFKINIILIVFAGIVALGALVVAAVLLTNLDKNQQIPDERIEGPPKLAYVSHNVEKSVEQKGMRDLCTYTVDEGIQEVAAGIWFWQIGANGQIVSYQFADEQPDAPGILYTVPVGRKYTLQNQGLMISAKKPLQLLIGGEIIALLCGYVNLHRTERC